MIQDKVYVVSYNGGVLGVYRSEIAAKMEASDRKRYGFKGVKVEEFNIYE